MTAGHAPRSSKFTHVVDYLHDVHDPQISHRAYATRDPPCGKLVQ